MGATPRSLDEVTADWLSEQLAATITSVDIDPIGAGEGFMGQLARVRLTSSDPDDAASR